MTLLEALNNDSKITKNKTTVAVFLIFFIFFLLISPMVFLGLAGEIGTKIGAIVFVHLYIAGCFVCVHLIRTKPQRIMKKYNNTFSSEERAQIEAGMQNGYIIHNFMVTPHYLIYVKGGNVAIIPYTAITNLYVDQQATSGNNAVAMAFLFGIFAGIAASQANANNYQLFIETLAGRTQTFLLPKNLYNDYSTQDLINRIQERRNSHYYEQIAIPPTMFTTRLKNI